jgi:hypothetical protein
LRSKIPQRKNGYKKVTIQTDLVVWFEFLIPLIKQLVNGLENYKRKSERLFLCTIAVCDSGYVSLNVWSDLVD